MSHTCHAHGCARRVPPSMFACKPHWFALPKKIRDAIWSEYRPGQEDDKQPSARYMAVQRLAVAHTAFKPHDEQAAYEAAQYMAEALVWQKRAIEMGQGDPLAGLVPRALSREAPVAAARRCRGCWRGSRCSVSSMACAREPRRPSQGSRRK